MEFRDYYSVLGVPRDATAENIKRAKRKLARKYHPDVSKEPDADRRMREINEAYEVLGDTEKRTAYDRLGQRYHAGQEFTPPPEWNSGFDSGRAGNFSETDFSDFFESLFGSARRGPAGGRRNDAVRGEDRHARIEIDLEDAFHGATRQISLQAPEVDQNGRLQVRERTLEVTIPRGIRAGQQIRLTGQGGAGQSGAPAGDIYLEVQFRPHRLYRVDSRDLYLTLPIAPWEAALGAQVRVPTPDGPVDLRIPPNSKSGRKLRLKARGIPGKPSGDLIVILGIELPEANTEKSRELYQSMAREMPFNPRAHLGV
ncbi:MAG: DnaJ C-terminal domain-containing protein [Burkholderiaceae bacterium]